MPGAYEQALRDTAELACDKCAELAGQQLKSLSGGRRAFYPNIDEETCRISVGVVDRYHYLVYQDTGFETFAMTALRGKTIPIKLENGQIIYRKAAGINEWRSGVKTYWRRNASGELVSSVEQRRAWVHPGLPPKNFMREAVTQAAMEKAQDIYEALLSDLQVS